MVHGCLTTGSARKFASSSGARFMSPRVGVGFKQESTSRADKIERNHEVLSNGLVD